jgi:hypothetical protein
MWSASTKSCIKNNTCYTLFMTAQLQQLIPGNPGTSFVTCLLFVLRQKYNKKVNNQDQLSLFTEGIVHSRKVFFSGVITQISILFKKKITFFSNSTYILRLAKSEINNSNPVLFNSLDNIRIAELLDTYTYIVLSVDMFVFRKYHDYHFVSITKRNDFYEIFEPKSGKIIQMTTEELEQLTTSVTIGLKDILMCFVL